MRNGMKRVGRKAIGQTRKKPEGRGRRGKEREGQKEGLKKQRKMEARTIEQRAGRGARLRWLCGSILAPLVVEARRPLPRTAVAPPSAPPSLRRSRAMPGDARSRSPRKSDAEVTMRSAPEGGGAMAAKPKLRKDGVQLSRALSGGRWKGRWA